MFIIMLVTTDSWVWKDLLCVNKIKLNKNIDWLIIIPNSDFDEYAYGKIIHESHWIFVLISWYYEQYIIANK